VHVSSGTRRRVKGDILIVEDDAVLANCMAEALQDEGYVTRRATTMAEAQEKLHQLRPAVAVVDLTLPDAFATDLIDELATRFEPAVPVVIVSTFPLANLVAARWGNQLVRKPYDVDDLLAAVHRAIEARRSSASFG
jgi:two-component system nitrogen regulation response regulator NtrX